MTFIELIKHLAQRLGQHQIPLNANAVELRRLLDSSALHYELMTRILRSIYERNHCRSLNDAVDSDATFEALAPIRLDVLRSPRTDIDVYRLMEDFCVAIAMVFDNKANHPALAKKSRILDNATEPGELIKLTPRRRFNFLA